MINDLEVTGLFPQPVGKTTIDTFTKKELNFFELHHKEILRENIGNFASFNNYILNEAPLKKLKNTLEENLNSFFMNVYKPSSKVKLRITQSWLNFTEKEMFHHLHNHKNSVISGVLYVNAVEGDCICFHNNYRTLSQLITETDSYGVFNSDKWTFYVKSLDLMLFPSSLMHEVPSMKNSHCRTSLAFNSFYVGTIGSNEKFTELVIS